MCDSECDLVPIVDVVVFLGFSSGSYMMALEARLNLEGG